MMSTITTKKSLWESDKALLIKPVASATGFLYDDGADLRHGQVRKLSVSLIGELPIIKNN